MKQTHLTIDTHSPFVHGIRQTIENGVQSHCALLALCIFSTPHFTLQAHDDAANIKLNQHHCPGVLYNKGRFDQNFTLSQKNNTMTNRADCSSNAKPEDNCGQFGEVLAVTQGFCSIKNQPLTQRLYQAQAMNHYYGPINFVEPNLRHNYTKQEGIDFSCRFVHQKNLSCCPQRKG